MNKTIPKTWLPQKEPETGYHLYSTIREEDLPLSTQLWDWISAPRRQNSTITWTCIDDLDLSERNPNDPQDVATQS